MSKEYLDMYLRTRITETGLYPKPSSIIEGAFHSALFINLQLRDIAYDKVPINLKDKTITFLVRRNKYPVDNDDIIILKTEQDGILVVDEDLGLIEIKITSDEMNHIPSDYWYDVQVHDIEEIEEEE